MKIFVRWEILLYNKYILKGRDILSFFPPYLMPSLTAASTFKLDVTVNEIRAMIGANSHADAILYPDQPNRGDMYIWEDNIDNPEDYKIPLMIAKMYEQYGPFDPSDLASG